MKLHIKALLLSAFTTLATLASMVVKPSVAEASYTYGGGIGGGISYARACNHGWGSSLKIVTNANSQLFTNRPATIDHAYHKVYSSQKFNNPWFGYTNNPNWRNASGEIRSKGRTSSTFTSTNNYPLQWYNKDKDVVVSQHVYRTFNGITTYVIDLGGIINLGKVEPNSCRQYENGNYSGT